MKISPLNFIPFVFILLLCGLSSLTAQNIHFPDPNFKQALLDAGVDTGNDGEISEAEAEGVTQLIVSHKNISDLTGIGYFTNLTLLYCSYNSLTNLDLDELTKLRILSCDNNLLSTLDLAALTNLESLSCSNNNLTVLDVDPLPNLVQLHCNGNNLTNLDLDTLANLTILNCSSNSLLNLEVGHLSSITYLNCDNNHLSRLDVDGLTKLQELNCENNSLTSLDVSGLTNLQELNCSNNSLTSLDVSLTNLEFLNCQDNSLTSIDVRDLTNLQALYCNNNSLTSLDVSGLTNLQLLLCSNNSLTSLDVSDLTNLQSLLCSYNSLFTIDIRSTPELEYLSAQGNPDLACIIVDDVNNLPLIISIDQDVSVFNTEPCSEDFDSFEDVSVLVEDVDLPTYTQAILFAKLKVAESSCTAGNKWLAWSTLITLDAMVNRLQQLGRLSESQAVQLRDAFDTMQNKIVSGEIDCSSGTAPNILDWITSWYSLESAGNDDSDEWTPATVYLGSPEKVIKSAPRIYPNPTTGRVSFSQIVSQIEVYNMMGQLMMKAEHTDHLDLHSYQAGVYVIRLINEAGEGSVKRVVKR